MWQIDRVGHPASMEGNPLGGGSKKERCGGLVVRLGIYLGESAPPTDGVQDDCPPHGRWIGQ